MIKLIAILQASMNDAAIADSLNQAGEIQMPLIQVAQKGGWLMLPIVLLFTLAIYIFIERFFAIQKASKVDTNFMNRIRDYIHDGKLDSALALSQSYDLPQSKMIEKGINRIGRPLSDVNAAIENTGRLEIYKLEKGLPLLATIAGGAPMIGFLGTVMGMIRAFYDMAMAGNNIDVGQLSNGIYTALVTTVAGLIVGVVGYFAYNILVSNVEKVVFQLEATTTEFMDLLNEPVK